MSAPTQPLTIPDDWRIAPNGRRAPKPRIRGLAMPALPSWPLIAQVIGSLGALGGVYLKLGLAVTLIVAGVALVALGMLREAGRI